MKRVVNLVISGVVQIGDMLARSVGRLLGRKPRATAVVLAYHAITTGQRERFGRQMDLLLRLAKPVHANLKSRPSQGGRYAAITFDDGLQSVVDNALPELKKRGIPATLFIVTEALGGPPNWQSFESGNAAHEMIMSAEQLKALPSDLVAIGSHTMTHPVLTAISEEELQRELIGSRAKLEKILDREVKLFSFPYGASNAVVFDTCRKAGYERVFTALPVLAFCETNEFVTGRVRIEPTDWSLEFRLKLAGAYRWLPTAYVWKRKLLNGFRRVPKTSSAVVREEKKIA